MGYKKFTGVDGRMTHLFTDLFRFREDLIHLLADLTMSLFTFLIDDSLYFR